MFSRNNIVSLTRRSFRLIRANTSYTSQQINSYSSSVNTQVVVADDGRTLVCWHPEPEIPYELTSPLPREEEVNQSAIKSLNANDECDVSHLEVMKEELARQELMKMTYSTKHRWFPRVGKREAKKTVMDRPYL